MCFFSDGGIFVFAFRIMFTKLFQTTCIQTLHLGECSDSHNRVLQLYARCCPELNVLSPDLEFGGREHGDYPLKSSLMTQYRDNGHLSASPRRYNFTHSSIRTVIERVFAQLRSAIDKIMSAFVLHYICILNADNLQMKEVRMLIFKM